MSDLGSDRLTFRKLLRVILPNLPRESAFKRKVDPVGAQWGPGDYIAADVCDLLMLLLWQNSGNDKAPRPKPYPRPGDAEKKQAEQDARAAALMAQAERARKRKAEEANNVV